MADEAQGAEDAAETRLNRLLDLILETAVEMLGYDAATASARHNGELSTVGATDQRLLALDEAQYASGDGPCLSVLDAGGPVRWTVEDDEVRWQAFRQAAEQAGITNSLSVHVPIDDTDEIAASLNFYARSQRELSRQQLRAAEGFAAQVAAAMQAGDAYKSTARLAAGLAEAMRYRAAIEQAKGILMSERKVSADEAFQLLVAMSQNSNVKVRDVAVRLVEARTGHRSDP